MTIKFMFCSVYSDSSDSTVDLFGSEVKRVGSGQTGTSLGWSMSVRSIISITYNIYLYVLCIIV
jgi:hypothetical protein